MSRHQRVPSLPETPGVPDAGFMAAAGAYVAAVFVALAVVISVAADASTASALGAVASAITVGLVAGGIASGHVRGLPERLGRGGRSMALPFVVPVAFAASALLVALVPRLSIALALGAAVGAGITAVPALAIASMSRTRYTKAMTPDEPLASTPLLNPNRDRRWIALGLLNALLLVLLSAGESVSTGQLSVGLVFFTLYALLYGIALRFESTDSDAGGRLRRYLSDRFEDAMEPQWLSELRVHEAGLTVKHPAQRRFSPWSAVEDVRLTGEELVVERRRFPALRCDRTVIEEPEHLHEAIERARGSQP
ncbi:PH domain-containing protein [Halalkalicoccus subterraneus]|uniref:PH domain-containing protein n=1 Tax=Halalkalicoccus subterraneus TaxID=2675002 RepID=UPI000EFB79CE|nr:PH domain-containing protein [Halalkalicoccus subterraneus]